MGGLHIEMVLLNVLGDWLNRSRWTSVLVCADITTEGRANHLLKGSEISRGQWVNEVSAAALHSLQQDWDKAGTKLHN